MGQDQVVVPDAQVIVTSVTEQRGRRRKGFRAAEVARTGRGNDEEERTERGRE